MSLTAHVSETRNGFPSVELRDGDKVVLKAYANESETKIRIVLVELTNYRQTKIMPESHLIEFTRSEKGGLQ